MPHAQRWVALRSLWLRESRSDAVTDAEILEAMRELARLGGLFVCPDGAQPSRPSGASPRADSSIPKERVVPFNTGSGLKCQTLLMTQMSLASSSLPR